MTVIVDKGNGTKLICKEFTGYLWADEPDNGGLHVMSKREGPWRFSDNEMVSLCDWIWGAIEDLVDEEIPNGIMASHGKYRITVTVKVEKLEEAKG